MFDLTVDYEHDNNNKLENKLQIELIYSCVFLFFCYGIITFHNFQQNNLMYMFEE